MEKGKIIIKKKKKVIIKPSCEELKREYTSSKQKKLPSEKHNELLRCIADENYKLSLDNLARIYALSLNEQQAAMLEKDGFNAKKIEEIKNILGKEIVEFVDKTVDYLSTEKYKKVIF